MNKKYTINLEKIPNLFFEFSCFSIAKNFNRENEINIFIYDKNKYLDYCTIGIKEYWNKDQNRYIEQRSLIRTIKDEKVIQVLKTFLNPNKPEDYFNFLNIQKVEEVKKLYLQILIDELKFKLIELKTDLKLKKMRKQKIK